MKVLPIEPNPEAHRLCPRPLWHRWQCIGQSALTLALALLFLTAPVPAPDNSVDSSLGAVLSYAHQEHWQYGRDVVFTYGPLGFLMFFYYAPHLAGARLVLDLALCLGVAAGLVLLAWRMPGLWRWLFLVYYAWVAPNLQGRGDFIINTGLCCWAILCAVESGRRLLWAVTTLTILAAFAAAAKISFLVSATILIVLVSIDLGLRGHSGNRAVGPPGLQEGPIRPSVFFRRFAASCKQSLAGCRQIALGMLLGYLGLFLLAWVAAGQDVLNLPLFLRNALVVVDAYNQALGYEGLWPVTIAGVFTAIALLVSVTFRTISAFDPQQENRLLRQLLLAAWCFFLGFTAWKHGFVRQDHAFYFLAFAPVLALALEGIPFSSSRLRLVARISTVLTCIGGITGLAWAQFPEFRPSLVEPMRSLVKNTRTVLHPAQYWRVQGEAMRANAAKSQLPELRRIIGNSTVDVFGQSQAYALNNALNYRPRPVFQSYVACSRKLMDLNARFYQSPSRPEYVLLTMEPLDSKIASLEDAHVLRELLFNYRHVATEGRYLLCRAASRKPVRLERVRAGSVRAGERIFLDDLDSPLWLEITLRPSFIGQLRQLLLRPAVTRLAVWGPDGNLLARRRAPASMLEAGFLLNPLILNNAELPRLFRGEPGRRAREGAIEVLPGEEKFWQKEINYTVYRVENSIGLTNDSSQVSPEFSPNSGTLHSTNTGSARPFKLFRTSRWRPDQPRIGGWGEQAALALFALAPVGCLAALLVLARRIKTGRLAANWRTVLVVNLVLLVGLCSLLLLGGEIYYRFVYDTTDALGYTKVSERWVARHWELNTAGCRDNIEYVPAITPGKRRVTFVGDSFTAGHGLRNVEDRLVNLWRRSYPDWETHTLSNVGLDTGGELTLLKKAVAQGYQLDQVVLVYCLNDIGDLLPQEASAFQGALAGVTESGWLPRNSYFVNLWYHRFRALQTDYVGDYHAWMLKAYNGPPWPQQQERFRALRDFVHQQGGHLSVLTYPFFDALGPGYRYASVHRQLHEAWSSLGVPHLDLLPAYQGLQPGELMVNRNDSHPNEEANRIAAEEMLRWVDSFPFGHRRLP